MQISQFCSINLYRRKDILFDAACYIPSPQKAGNGLMTDTKKHQQRKFLYTSILLYTVSSGLLSGKEINRQSLVNCLPINSAHRRADSREENRKTAKSLWNVMLVYFCGFQCQMRICGKCST